MSQELADLRELAALYGVQASYHDIGGRLVEAAPESLLAVVSALAGPLDGMGEVAEALAARRAELDTRLIEPVLVAWDGLLAEVSLRLPAGGAGDIGGGGGGGRGDGGAADGSGSRSVACHLDLESGERRARTHDLERLPARRRRGRRRLAFPEALPLGYHRLEVKTGGRTARALVIAAPRRAPRPGGCRRAGEGSSAVPRRGGRAAQRA